MAKDFLTDQARLKAVTTKESGAWLNALPVASLGTLLDDESFRISIENTQPFLTLPLNIEKVKTVREALKVLVSENKLEGVTSSKINERVEAWEQITLCKLSVILILHLKFFEYSNDRCMKIIKAFDFEFDLKFDSTLISLETQSPIEKQYKLFAVVYHEGKNANIGHYVTDAFHVGYNCWIRYDDSSVKTVQKKTY
ncbi:ubiquitin carboxyl-terminal hydrolase 10-B-like [Leptinotarsa decemlineata]|uniref:ubiquitin carboxyl-terminal hydrolase 10-B-like n=1 Tax=Leptinotarsa decemlineata TaxID=7539 RepID=UPI003D30C9C2